VSFGDWLDARDGEAVARAWSTLGATRVEVGRHPRFVLGIRPEGAALLAAAFLGGSPERFAWFAAERPQEDEEDLRPPPTFAVDRTVPWCFLDGAVDVKRECGETWVLREVIEGTRGLQFITLDHVWGEQTRDGSGGGGGSASVVRLFDRTTSNAVSLRLWSNDVWTIGSPIDLAPLDLFAHRASYKLRWARPEIDPVRGLLAQLTADLDAHFDTSTTWPGGVTEDLVIENREYNFRTRRRVQRFESGPYAIQLDESLDPDGDDHAGLIFAVVNGLPWGHELKARICATRDPVWGVDGWIDFTLPLAQLEAAVARLAAIPEIEVT
jgi:hypothetical protein